ncbi:uncharacterized protein CLUP02_08541 [Colletotrichum lupini]|uniref:Uncharacterized protein n=1 Tax=Colletotrichum lupini TaxID=145971 RepID=A0A9Q8SU16_9PEZI|nr:uncharacterized protein CLUP02_08541 [Colletotrichum lupini]UQC83050.1 hypothetical protein CLUP02_08541 [Colletotrichum lupini]
MAHLPALTRDLPAEGTWAYAGLPCTIPISVRILQSSTTGPLIGLQVPDKGKSRWGPTRSRTMEATLRDCNLRYGKFPSRSSSSTRQIHPEKDQDTGVPQKAPSSPEAEKRR